MKMRGCKEMKSINLSIFDDFSSLQYPTHIHII